jgi:hypothetical protein
MAYNYLSIPHPPTPIDDVQKLSTRAIILHGFQTSYAEATERVTLS